jgi:hypothetical protein
MSTPLLASVSHTLRTAANNRYGVDPVELSFQSYSKNSRPAEASRSDMEDHAIVCCVRPEAL